MTGVLGIAAVASIAALAAACSTNPGDKLSSIEKVFVEAVATWDLDKDGKVTCVEWKNYAGELFDRADRNRDGSLTPDEFQSIIAEDRLFDTANFAYYDTGKKGRITRAEFVDRPNPAFQLLDHNRNCELTSAEIAGSRALIQPTENTAWMPDHKMPRK